MTDPVHIFKNKERDICYKKTAWSVAAGNGFIPPEYPILGAFMTNYLSYDPSNVVIREDVYKTVSTDTVFKIDVEDATTAIEQRYGICPQSCKSMDDLILSAVVPSVLKHPGFTCLLEADYC